MPKKPASRWLLKVLGHSRMFSNATFGSSHLPSLNNFVQQWSAQFDLFGLGVFLRSQHCKPYSVGEARCGGEIEVPVV